VNENPTRKSSIILTGGALGESELIHTYLLREKVDGIESVMTETETETWSDMNDFVPKRSALGRRNVLEGTRIIFSFPETPPNTKLNESSALSAT
jgi:hypothetical protein